MSIIYLDEWVYVTLLRTYKGLSPEYPKYAEICKGLIESSQKGINRFPLSLAHLEETTKRIDLCSRKDLFKFMFDLSKFYAIRPWVQVVEPEVKNAILKSLGAEPTNLSDYIFGNELFHCYGSKAQLESKEPNKEVPDDVKEKVFSAYKDPESMANALSMEQDIDDIKELDKQYKALADKIEELRKRDYGHPDKTRRRNISDARFFITVILDTFTKVELELGLDQEYTKRVISSKDSAQSFLESIPSAYVFHLLSYRRNTNFSRAIEPNDFWDIFSLAIAVPYCDVVVTEREWAQILNEKKIGELFDTRITHKIEDLSEFIP
jgi:hypothetical protein